MSRFVLYVDTDGKTKVKVSEESLREDYEKKRKLDNEKKNLEKKSRNEYYLRKWIEKRRLVKQEGYIKWFIKTFQNNGYDEALIRRFFSKVDIKDENDCWAWLAFKNREGYGYFGYNGKVERANRISWLLHNGVINEDMLVLHRCDNPSCVNPKHLFLGTYQDNSEDKVIKGRSHIPKGERNPNCKLTENQVGDIKRLYSSGKYSQNDLAMIFCVSRSAIKHIVNNKNWKEVV